MRITWRTKSETVDPPDDWRSNIPAKYAEREKTKSHFFKTSNGVQAAASKLCRLAFALLVPLAYAQIAPSELVAPKMEISDGNLIFTIETSVSGRNYQLQSSDSMAGGTWTDVGVMRSGDGSNIVIRSRRALAANNKACLFSGAPRIEGKNQAAVTFRPCWRMLLALPFLNSEQSHRGRTTAGRLDVARLVKHKQQQAMLRL